MNPYFNSSFFQFFLILGGRLWALVRGDLAVDQLSADEVQLLVLGAIAISSSLVGVFLTLRKMAMLSNSISHTILLGIVIVYLFTRQHYYTGEGAVNIEGMLIAAFAMGILTALLTEWMTKILALQEDASMGLVFTTLFALGIIAVTLFSRNAHVGAEIVMGNVDALQLEDCKLALLIMGGNLLLFLLFFKEYKITTFDSGLARALGISPTLFNYLLMVQVSATIVGAFRAVGVLMVLAFITAPALTALLLANSLKRVLAISVGIGLLAALCGVALARHLLSIYGLAFSTAGLVVCLLLAFYLLALIYKKVTLRPALAE